MLSIFSNWQVFAQRAFRLGGYEIRRHRFSTSSHEPIFPLSTYAPWNTDPLFVSAYAQIKHHTLVDKYRCFGLWQLAQQTEKIPGAIVEIGSWRGGTGALLALQASAKSGPIYLCDTFRGLVKTGPEDNFFKDGDLAVARPEVENFLFTQLGLRNIRLLEGMFPEESGSLLDCPAIRLCHIDVDVYESARATLDFIWPRLSVGGVVVFDDYGSHACRGIQLLVDEQAQKKDRMLVYNLNGHGLLFKLA